MIEDNKHGWISNDMKGLKEKIRFKDRIEYRVSGQLHNTTGPAIIYFDEPEKKASDKELFYIKGVKYTKREWSVKVRPVKLKRIKRNIEAKKELDN